MNTEIFTGKAEAYAKARPSYPVAAIDYICSIAPQDAVFADIGAGTGKLTVLLAERGYTVLAVEPNADMQSQLTDTLAPYTNAKSVAASAESTTLPDHSVDVVTCAQALHWFDTNAFRAECKRILKPGGIVVAVYNTTANSGSANNCSRSTNAFFADPIIHEFPNPIFYTREHWLTYMTSHSHDPLPSDPQYAAHMAEMNAIFDRESTCGMLRRDVVTTVYSEEILPVQA